MSERRRYLADATSALGTDGFDERGGEGARVGLGFLGGGEDAVGLEVGVAGIRGLQLRIEVGLEAGDGGGRLAQQGVDFAGRIEPDGHASSRKPLRPLGKRRRPDRARTGLGPGLEEATREPCLSLALALSLAQALQSYFSVFR